MVHVATGISPKYMHHCGLVAASLRNPPSTHNGEVLRGWVGRWGMYIATTGASNLPTENTKDGKDGMYEWTNTGPCLDLFAPGEDIFSACGGSRRCHVASDVAYTSSNTTNTIPDTSSHA